jgi:hypothetical protein
MSRPRLEEGNSLVFERSTVNKASRMVGINTPILCGPVHVEDTFCPIQI